MSVYKDYHDNKVVKHVFLASTIVCLYVRTTMTIRLSNMSSLPVQLYVCMDYHDNTVVKHVFLASTIVCLYGLP